MTSPTNPCLLAVKLSTSCLTLSALALFALPAMRALADETQDRSVEWLAAPPCEESYAHPLAGQPAIGLGLFRFDCPGQPSRLVSGKQQLRVHGMLSAKPIARGDSLDSTMFVTDDAPQWIYRLGDMPLDPQQVGKVQARRAIAPGQRIYARDFEPRRLWIGGEQIAISMVQGSVTTTIPAQSLGMGRLGERSSAKAEGGKTFSGVASLCGAAPCLLVQLSESPQ